MQAFGLLPIQIGKTLQFKGLGGRVVNLKYLQFVHHIQMSKGKGIQSRPENYILPHSHPDSRRQTVFRVSRPADGGGYGQKTLHGPGLDGRSVRA